MLVSENIVIIGGDKRMDYTANILSQKGFLVQRFDFRNATSEFEVLSSLSDALKNSHSVIGPIPFSRDSTNLFTESSFSLSLEDLKHSLKSGQILFGGNIPDWMTNDLRSHGTLVHDFMKSEDIALKNAVATAEGSIAEAIQLSERNLHKSHCLVLGFGRCGKSLAYRLKGLGAYVTVSARRQEQLLQAALQGHDMLSLNCLLNEVARFDFIFNTIPSMILTKDIISCLSKDSIIIDIASNPGGTDFPACKEYGITASLSLGLPGKYSPKTSAEILVEEIEKVLCHSISYGAAKAAECEGS